MVPFIVPSKVPLAVPLPFFKLRAEKLLEWFPSTVALSMPVVEVEINSSSFSLLQAVIRNVAIARLIKDLIFIFTNLNSFFIDV